MYRAKTLLKPKSGFGNLDFEWKSTLEESTSGKNHEGLNVQTRLSYCGAKKVIYRCLRKLEGRPHNRTVFVMELPISRDNGIYDMEEFLTMQTS